MYVPEIKVLSSVVGDQHIRERHLGTLEIDQHANGATCERAIFDSTNRFPIDGKGKRIAIRKNSNRVDTSRAMPLVELMPKCLRPYLRPWIDCRTFTIIVLVESVLPTIVVKDFEAIERVNGPVARSLLTITEDHTIGIIGTCIIAFYLLHRECITYWPLWKRFLQDDSYPAISKIRHMVGAIFKLVYLGATCRDREIPNICAQRVGKYDV